MNSYLEILNELMETIETDSIPTADKKKIINLIYQLRDWLWKYSD